MSRRPWVERTFRRTLNADEHFLQTLVVGSPFVDRLRVAPDGPDRNGAARLIDWSRGGGHSPHVWRMDDLDVLLAGPEKGYVFARKFSSTTDAAVMAAITERCW